MLSRVTPDVNIEPEVRDLDYVPRWSIVRKVHHQSVASHIYFVARYAMQIAELMQVPVRQEFMWAILTHEDDELHSGDIPQPFKQKHGLQSPPIKGLLETEQWILKVADILESVLFLADEIAMGNTTMLVPYQHLRDRLFNKVGNNRVIWRLCNDAITAHMEYKGRTE